MTDRYDLVALGDPVLDLILGTDELPRWDDKHLGRSARWASGGSEANVACAAARLGLRCALLGHAGQGPGAAVHKADLARHGVSLEYLRSDDGIDGAVAVVYVSPAGERAITYVPASGRVADLDDQLAAVAARARLLYTLPYSAPRLLHVAEQAHAHGARVAVDVERAVLGQPRMREALCEGPDLLCFNASGFRSFTGDIGIDERVMRRVLAQARAEAIVVTLGRAGAVGIDRGGPMVVQPAWPAEVHDTTGAGDAFNGAWLAAWLQGVGMERALQQGAHTAACCVAVPGPRAYLAQIEGSSLVAAPSTGERES